jgi:hypothetical protein
MPAVIAVIEHLADLPLYSSEKPYLCLLSPEQKIDPDKVRLDNLEFTKYGNVKIEDMREHPELQLEKCGFEYLQHESVVQKFTLPEDVDRYRAETEILLKKRFGAAKVVTYECKLRKNEEFRRKQFDLNDKLLLEGPAKGAHNGKRLHSAPQRHTDDSDVTFDSGPNIICRYLSPEDQSKFLQPGYRIRIYKYV